MDGSLVAKTEKTDQGTHEYDVWLTDAEIVLLLGAALERVGKKKRSARLARTIGDLVRCFLLGS